MVPLYHYLFKIFEGERYTMYKCTVPDYNTVPLFPPFPSVVGRWDSQTGTPVGPVGHLSCTGPVREQKVNTDYTNMVHTRSEFVYSVKSF